MRQVLIDYARRRGAEKRGGDAVRTTLSDQELAVEVPVGELLALNDALDRLAEVDEPGAPAHQGAIEAAVLELIEEKRAPT
jgi:hypothetical protein